jgi:acetoin utilization deacetylase AcuC-like enzyme
MHAYFADIDPLQLPAGHRFPAQKYAMLREALRALPAIHVRAAPLAPLQDLLRVHDAAYVDGVMSGRLSADQQRDIGLPWTPITPLRSRRSVGATLAAMRAAQRDGVAANLGGGTHHAHADGGRGFCVFNDVAVATRQAQAMAGPGRSVHVAIIDLDVHQGDGTARIFANDPSVFTLSLHGEKNYPFDKAHSDLDLELPDGCSDGRYLQALDHALEVLDARCRPDLVFYLAGADVHHGDRLGRLALTDAGVAERDQRVLDWVKSRALPLVLCMAGGYGHDLAATVAIQRQTLNLAQRASIGWRVARPFARAGAGL